MNRYVDKKTGHSETTVKEIEGERRAAVFDNTLTYANRVGCVLKDNGQRTVYMYLCTDRPRRGTLKRHPCPHVVRYTLHTPSPSTTRSPSGR